MKTCKIIANAGEVKLVEWEENGKLKRGSLPAYLAEPGKPGTFFLIDTDLFEQEIIPYGYPWATILPNKIDVGKLEDEFYRAGIWTVEDFLAHPNEVVNLIRSTLTLEVSDISKLLKEDSNE